MGGEEVEFLNSIDFSRRIFDTGQRRYFDSVPIYVGSYKKYVLCAQCKRRARYRRRQAQSADNLLPQLLGDDRHDAASLHDQLVQGVQIQHPLRHDRQTTDRRPCESDIRNTIQIR